MDQKTSNGESAAFEIPEQQFEDNSTRPENTPDTDATNVTEKSMSKSVEAGTLGSFSNLGAPPTIAHPVDPSALMTPPPAQTPAQGSSKQIKVITDDLHAGDTDLIEKAWVVKAKAIVEKTKDDPYEQTKELKKIKADYQRKRFNNNLKIDDE